MRMRGLLGTTMRGSLGGLTFTANQFQSNIVRERVSPVNPNTTAQALIRSSFSGAEELWENLTQTVRDAWDQYASSLVYNGPTGAYSVPGRQVFIGNISLATYLKSKVGVPPVIATDAPVIPGFLNVDSVTTAGPGAIGTGFSVNITYNGAESIDAFAYKSVPFNASRLRFKGPFLTDSIDFALIAPPAIGIIDFLDLTEDLAFFSSVRAITDVAPFRISNKFIVRAIAETNP